MTPPRHRIATAAALCLPPLALVLLLASSCASGTASAPVSNSSRAKAAADGPKKVSLLCNPSIAFVSFATLGVPQDETPIAVAVTDQADYVLFTPARLLRLDRGQGSVRTAMVIGQPGETWTAMDVDPTDGSLWIVDDHFVLIHVLPGLRLVRLPIPRVVGTGGFDALRVTADAIYATPICAADAVWRLDRSGKVISSTFPVEPTTEVQPAGSGCSKVRLERDRDGRILAWDTGKGTVQQVDAQGVWTPAGPADSDLFTSLSTGTVVHGVDVGSRQEQWYLSSFHNLFYWKGQPVWLGARTIKVGSPAAADTVLLLPRKPVPEALIESCKGHALLAVAASSTRYAALIRIGIVLGDFASAPDLP
ncbi:MAG: hypothetical protein M3O15_05985 [Acidobacteriota bacterium]|nr:hypothetical protein [Acidobacteriota bacterium]